MRRKRVIANLALILVLARPAMAVNRPSDPPVETERSFALRAVYFPFLAVGHGVLLILKYGVAYPVYYLAKPVYDTLWESSEDPAELSHSRSSSSP